MAKAHRKKRPATAGETLAITTGNLGPLGKCQMEVRPLTVLIGKQGTGKSLVAQVLYLFRGLPELVRLDLASRRPGKAELAPERIVRRIVDGLRSSRRSFARLTVPSVGLRWRGALAVDGVHAAPHELTFSVQSQTSQVYPGAAMKSLVTKIRDTRRRGTPPLTSVFVPTERLLYAMQLGPASLRVMSAPLLLETFSQMMEQAGRVQTAWPNGLPDTDHGRWIRERLSGALAGEAQLRGSSWRWRFQSRETVREIDLDMASSGQRANWPLSLIPQVLFSLRAEGQLAEQFTLYVEEPEIHLHPGAERAVVDVLAYLVNQGIRVVLTTHSLTVLYAINNLLLASDLEDDALEGEIPPRIRLRAGDVICHHLLLDGSVKTLEPSPTIDERGLGEVADDLAAQMTSIARRRGPM